MSALNFTKLADAPILEEVPDGAKVYAEVDGKVYRVAGDNLGGGGGSEPVVIHLDASSITSVQSLLSGAATVDSDSSTQTFPVTCDMAYNEALAAARSGKLDTVLDLAGTAFLNQIVCGVEGDDENVAPTTLYFFPKLSNQQIGVVWAPDGRVAMHIIPLT